MKMKRPLRRFFLRFNPWLYLVCLLLAAIIWCGAMYVNDPDGLRDAGSAATVAVAVTDNATL